ncbi:hypothetical protein DFJ74DRAFT_680995 [Hyaloraphidium curvatum]|nr:hypothetical protein DFJ74DRAFT_680995 [Hyaloraphidium curvatum]
MPHAVVLGAGGYIGLAVVRAFASAGYEVFAVARRDSQADEITRAGGNPIICSVTDVSKWRHAAALSSCVVMCSGSARTPPEEHRAMFDAILRVTLETTREVGTGRKTLIYTCGLAVFGNADTILAQRTVEETSELGQGLWPGILSRREIEKELLANGEVNGIVIRPGYVYGASGGPLGGFIREAMLKGTITGYGDPEAPVSAVHVDDLAECYVLAAQHGDVVRGQAFNLSNLNSERRRSCYAAIARAVGLPESAVTFSPAPPNMTMLTRAMYAPAHKAANLLGWRQRRPSFVDGIARWVREYRTFNPDVVAKAKL